MRTAIVFTTIATIVNAASPWDPKYAQQAKVLLAKMNLTNKLDMLHGWGGDYVGDVPTIITPDGTVIPALHLHDGPQGVANGNTVCF